MSTSNPDMRAEFHRTTSGVFSKPELVKLFGQNQPEEIFPDDFMAAADVERFNATMQTIEDLAAEGRLEFCYLGYGELSPNGKTMQINAKSPNPAGTDVYSIKIDHKGSFGDIILAQEDPKQGYWAIYYKDSQGDEPVLIALKYKTSEKLIDLYARQLKELAADLWPEFE